MDHLQEHQRSTIDLHHGFEKQTGLGAEGAEEAQEIGAGFDHGDGEEEEEEEDASNIGEMEDEIGGCVDIQQHHHVVGQLSISYQDQLYHFDDITAEKVQSVLNVLGGQEISVCSTTYVNAVPYTAKTHLDTTGGMRMSPREREEVIRKYREKRERRVWGKRILYDVRSNVARKMVRHKGQFASHKVKEEDTTSDQKPSTAEEAGPNIVVCRHCHCTSENTPMLRKGPDGPRSLCNACGLMWASKGILRPLKPGQVEQQEHKVYTPSSRGTKRKASRALS